ncbi:MAG: VWA domain-containing protein, partial [Terriglobia bacterium]
MKKICGIVALGAVCTLWALAQEAPGPQAQLPAAVLRVTTRLVLVHVVVTDKQRRPVTDLTLQDFILQENGKRQKIAVFSLEQLARRVREQPAPPPLPPHVYTNRPEYRKPAGLLTVLLLDLLNTPVRDQAYAHAQLLRYLSTQLRSGHRIAVLALTSKMFLLQDFTSDPELLRA